MVWGQGVSSGRRREEGLRSTTVLTCSRRRLSLVGLSLPCPSPNSLVGEDLTGTQRQEVPSQCPVPGT